MSPKSVQRSRFRITPVQASEFTKVLSLLIFGDLRGQGLSHSVATGSQLPDGPLRIQVEVDEEGTELLWGLAGREDPGGYAHPELGRRIFADEFPPAMIQLESRLDPALLVHSKGDPVVRRLTLRELALHPELDQDGAAVLCPGKRSFIPYFPWRQDDKFAIGGRPAREAVELAGALEAGTAAMIWMPGGNPLVLINSPGELINSPGGERPPGAADARQP